MKDTLKVTTPGDREIVVTREFDAPRELVWEAMNRSDLLPRWLAGPPGWTMTKAEGEPRVGGSFHWEWSGPDGAALKMTGVYREVVPPGRCTRTEAFEMIDGPPMGEQLATVVLEEVDGRTRMAVTIEMPSREARDGALASGMTEGMGLGYERLDALLEGATPG